MKALTARPPNLRQVDSWVAANGGSPTLVDTVSFDIVVP
jgi:hypothetical protein